MAKPVLRDAAGWGSGQDIEFQGSGSVTRSMGCPAQHRHGCRTASA